MTLRYTTRPLSDRTWLGTMGKKPTQFKAKWADTLDLLEREIAALNGSNVVLEIDVTESDLKLDGTLRAHARPSSSAVRLAFDSEHGPLLYRCDRFVTNWSHQGPEWQHNVRAIALSLEALRAVDRYGTTETGEQYTGFLALTSAAHALGAGATAAAPPMTSHEAALLIRSYAAPGTSLKDAWRAGVRRLHPDANHGNTTPDWLRLQEAAKVLGIAS